MNVRVRRKIAAFVLLTVYLSMLLVASLHVHAKAFHAITDCEQCVHHQVHNGHLTANDGGQHVCLLCQFLTLSYTAVVVATVLYYTNVRKIRYLAPDFQTERISRGVVGLRAPPFLFSSYIIR